MKKLLFSLAVLFSLNSCATLSKSQVENVHQFAAVTGNFSAYPSAIMQELAEIRVKRGLFYSSTLQDPVTKVNELDSIHRQKQYDYRVSANMDVTFRILDKYAQSLLLLSAEDYTGNFQEYSTQLGVGMDSLTTLYNTTSATRKLPNGIGEALGNILGYGGERYIRSKQADKIKEYVTRAAPLVETMTINLVEYLQSSNLQELISYEETMIRRNYLSYLQLNEASSFESQRDYLELKSSLDATKVLRTQTLVATMELQEAHNALVEIIQKKQKVYRRIKELQDFYQKVAELRQMLKDLENNQN